ncbi:MAG TPA: carboxypeptidase regulatory-like domain-containing protein, partial [Gemmatimonadaceae bacterium]|nr:carboxypeptidase regulatory-like domain-containing protein [Gemmatimonadaceae bacterium]
MLALLLVVPGLAAAQSVTDAKAGAKTTGTGADNGASGQPAQSARTSGAGASGTGASKPAASAAGASSSGATKPGGGMPRLAAPPTLSGAFGIVVDSIHGGPLPGAVVTISGTDRQGIADSTGKFRIDSIPPGTYQIALFHPLLDSLGLAIGTNPVEFPAGRYTIIAIGTPSPATLVASFCPPEKRITGNGILIGRVEDADTDEPVPGAKVSFIWSQLEAGKDIGVRHIPRIREATVDETGAYHICGIPDRVQGTARATTATFTTADLPMDFSQQQVQIVTFHVSKPDTVTPPPVAVAPADTTKGKTRTPATGPAPKRAVALRTGHATLTGVVYNVAGRGIPDADVTVFGAASTTTTDSTGHFTLRNLPSGTQTLVVKRLSYGETDKPVEISATKPASVIVKLDQAAPTLAKITVTAKWEQELKKIGFTDRKKSGLGKYQTREEIEAKLPQNITDVFQTTPGLTVDYSGREPVLRSSRSSSGGCVNYMVDGVPYKEQSPGDINDYMRPTEIEATEVYNSEETPGEFQSAGSTSCTTILIWTKTR